MNLKSVCLLIALLHTAVALQAQPVEISAEVPFTPDRIPLEGLVITLDAGHGGSAHQPGYAESARGTKSRVVEGDLNMLVAGELRHHLLDAGAEVHMTRWDDRRVTTEGALSRAEELGARTRVAEETRSHLFISCHHNSTERTTATGVVILIWPKDKAGQEQPLELRLAECLTSEVEKMVPHRDWFKPYVVDHPLSSGFDVPAAVIEFGFLTNPEFDAWVSQPGSHRAEARGAYNGIVKFWTEHREELEAIRKKNFPDTSPYWISKGTLDDKAAVSLRLYDRLLHQIWPFSSSISTTTEAQALIACYRKSVITDPTFFLFQVSVEERGGGFALTGRTNYERLSTCAEQLLRLAGAQVVANEIEHLPSPRLGSKRFGVIQIPMALTWGEPTEGENVQTQVLLGERVMLLDENPEKTHVLIHGGDGYIGWVRNEAVLRLTEPEFAVWENADYATVTKDYLIDDFRVPAGASLPIVWGGSGSDGINALTVRLPKGVKATAMETTAALPARNLSWRPRGAQTPGRTVALAAAEFLTTPYVFGGRSKLGLDCSGLTGVAYAAAGLTLPRDAKQQVIVGKLVATPWHFGTMQPGDLLFFCDETGKVMHTGVSLGGSRFIHSSPPEVQVSSLDESDPLYSGPWKRQFVFARRPLQ
ncbi:MAG: N-acetylmuramoyl-L-alanine amidase [Candidatus Sumerlaeaceae bacterium]|nr:N-acetylmuramoyl-L-alanine amidase [Candidatus Sumerlaeaceae bacterium]